MHMHTCIPIYFPSHIDFPLIMETMALNFPRPKLFDNIFDNSLHESKYYTPLEFNDRFTDSPENISLLHINLRSLNRNFEYFENLLYSIKFNFSVIGISETWLHNNSPQLFNIPNYTLIRADRQERRGGGVAFYIADNLKYKIRYDIKFEQAEVLFIEVINDQLKNVVIGLIYRPPNSNFELFFEHCERCLHKLAQENKHVYFLGDFNIYFLSLPRSNINADRLTQLMYSYGFCSFINKPTRINVHSSTLIDNIFSNVSIDNITGGILCSEVSDHLPVVLYVNIKYLFVNRSKMKCIVKKLLIILNFLNKT